VHKTKNEEERLRLSTAKVFLSIKVICVDVIIASH